MNPFIQIMRVSRGLMVSLAVLVGALVAGSWDAAPIILAMSSAFLIFSGGTVINDYFDHRIDKVNAPHRAIPSGRMKRKTAFYYFIFLYALGIILASLINIYCLALVVINAIILYLYSWRLKSSLLIGNIADSWLTATAFMLGSLVIPDIGIVWILALLSFWITMGREIFGDIEDIQGDKRFGARTLPIVTSEGFSRRVAQLFVIIGVALSPLPYLMGLLGLSYIVLVLVADLIFIISMFLKAETTQKTITIGMVIAMIAFLAGIF
jgi:geranylgeranylglycerol-phosphate geranylgeranyltransferase